MSKAQVVGVTVVSLATIGLAQAQAPLVLVQRIPLPRVNGRFDHLAIDRDQQRLYVAALGNDTVEVIDLRAGRQMLSLSGLHEPQGIAVAPDLKRVIIANGDGGAVQIRDTADPHVAVTHTVSLSDDADNVRYDAAARRAYVGYGGGALAAIDPADG